MNELQLREFRTRAEELVDLPDLAELEGRGRRLHRRRIAFGTAAMVGVLALAGGIAAVQRDDPDAKPIEHPDDRSSDVRYPGPVMEILNAGTYLLQPSMDADAPRARVTLPEGWNAWEGPNRFDGDLETTGWYAGLLVLDVDAVASRPCQMPRSDDVVGDTRAELVSALQGLPGARVRVAETVPADMFGHPATHLRMTFPDPPRKCQVDVNVLISARNGIVAGADDSLRDVWVIDVDGNAILVAAGYSSETPPEIRDELAAIVDSIEFVDPE